MQTYHTGKAPQEAASGNSRVAGVGSPPISDDPATQVEAERVKRVVDGMTSISTPWDKEGLVDMLGRHLVGMKAVFVRAKKDLDDAFNKAAVDPAKFWISDDGFPTINAQAQVYRELARVLEIADTYDLPVEKIVGLVNKKYISAVSDVASLSGSSSVLSNIEKVAAADQWRRIYERMV